MASHNPTSSNEYLLVENEGWKGKNTLFFSQGRVLIFIQFRFSYYDNNISNIQNYKPYISYFDKKKNYEKVCLRGLTGKIFLKKVEMTRKPA